MASRYEIGLFNPTLASLLAAASAFAFFAMPGELLRASLDGIGLASAPVGASTRAVFMAASAGSGFLLALTALRTCDRPRREDAEAIDLAGRDWPSHAEPEPVSPDLDDPFTELARGAQRADEPLELASEQIAPAPLPVSAGASELVQRLNAGLAEREWPLSPDAADEAVDRLRGVLRNLRAASRAG